MGKSFTLANNQNDALFELIKSLSKSEKKGNLICMLVD